MSSPTRTITIRPSAEQLAELEEHAGEEYGQGLPSVIQSLLGRYLEICRRELPPLTDPQWALLRDALNGVRLLEDPRSVAWIDRHVEDAIHLRQIDTKHRVDGAEFLSAIRSWSYAQRVALIDTIERSTLAQRSSGPLGVTPHRINAEPSDEVPSNEPWPGLTTRQREVAELICAGKDRNEIATILGCTPKTVDSHRLHILTKLGLRNAVELIRRATKEGWVTT